MADDSERDPYQVLGVAPGASTAEVTSAYRRLVRDLHPDSHSGAPADSDPTRLGDVLAAYEVLRDPHRRAAYDGRHRRPPTARPAPAGGVTIPVRHVDGAPSAEDGAPLLWVGPVVSEGGATIVAGGRPDRPLTVGDLLRALDRLWGRWF